MKRLRFRFYPYISACVFFPMLAIIMLLFSLFTFTYKEIYMGILSALLAIILIFCLWLVLRSGIIINFKKNRVTIFSGIKRKIYAIDKIKEISISFRFDDDYKRWAAKVTIYLNNSKSATFTFDPSRSRFITVGIPLHNKERIERNAKKCNFIRCYTAK